MMRTHGWLPLLASLGLSGCGVPASSFAYFEHRESRPFTDRYLSLEVTRELFDAHPELHDGPLLIVPKVRNLAWEPERQSSVLFFSTSPQQIEVDRIEVSSGRRPATAILKVRETIRLSKVPDQPGLYRHWVDARFDKTAGAGEILARSPVEMVVYYRETGSGIWQQKRFLLKRSVKVGQVVFDILAAC